MGSIFTTLAGLFRPDERFIEHRYRSTRAAMVVGVLFITGLFEFDLIVNRSIRWDLLAILGVIAFTKAMSMIYLRRTQ